MASEGSVTPGVAAIQITGLTRRFGSRVAVDDLHIRVEPGDIYGFLGPNGAGKTTAIRCALGLIRRDAGAITIFGETHPVAQRRHVGAMVETPAFHDWMSARDNLSRACAFAGVGGRQDIDRALEQVGLLARGDEKVRAYSLGMRQRLGIARALVGRPKLLMLDEPTNGLDPRGMKEVRDLLQRLSRTEGLTIFVSSHLLSEIEQLCNRVGIIEKGRLVAEGAVHQLVAGRAGVSEVDVGSADTAALERALRDLAGVTVVGDGEEDRLRLRLDSLDVPGLNRALVQAGVPLTALVPVQRSLEDLFLSLTSEELS